MYLRSFTFKENAGQKIEWDSQAMKVTNMPEINQCLSRQYREGWTL